MEQGIDFERERKRLTRKAWRATTAYAILLLVLSSFVVFGESGVDSFREMNPNEVGDLLAGVAGPVAFIWLVYGYFLQGIAIRQQAEELHQNTNALALQEIALQAQVAELQQSVLQQIELARLTKQQLDFDREKHKSEKEAERKKIAPLFEYHLIDPDGFRGVKSPFDLQVHKRIEIELVNLGSDAIDVRLICYNKSISIGPESYSLMKANQPRKFSVLFHTYDFPGEVNVILHYMDILRIPHLHIFSILFKKDNRDLITYEIVSTDASTDFRRKI